jgi:hypothetical protein
METNGWRSWLRPYVWPTLAMIVAIAISVLLFDESISGFIAFVVCWTLAFLTGYSLRPVHAWVTPAVLVVLGVIASYVAAEIGDYDPPGGIWVFIGLVILAGAPLAFLIWIGKEIGLTRDEMKPRTPTA